MSPRFSKYAYSLAVILAAANTPVHAGKTQTDAYLKGYLQALIDAKYANDGIEVEVSGKEVVLMGVKDDPEFLWNLSSLVGSAKGVDKVSFVLKDDLETFKTQQRALAKRLNETETNKQTKEPTQEQNLGQNQNQSKTQTQNQTQNQANNQEKPTKQKEVASAEGGEHQKGFFPVVAESSRKAIPKLGEKVRRFLPNLAKKSKSFLKSNFFTGPSPKERKERQALKKKKKQSLGKDKLSKRELNQTLKDLQSAGVPNLPLIAQQISSQEVTELLAAGKVMRKSQGSCAMQKGSAHRFNIEMVPNRHLDATAHRFNVEVEQKDDLDGSAHRFNVQVKPSAQVDGSIHRFNVEVEQNDHLDGNAHRFNVEVTPQGGRRVSSLSEDEEVTEPLSAALDLNRLLACNNCSSDSLDQVRHLQASAAAPRPPNQPHEGKPIWLPGHQYAFPTIVADPRQVTYSAAHRWHDQALAGTMSAVSIGDELPIVLWEDTGYKDYRGSFQISLQAAAWAVFDLNGGRADLVNSDWMAALPMTFTINNWMYRFRYYHVSSHLGDEFMIRNPWITRLNPSYEAVDLTAKYDLSEKFRFFGGLGYILRSDSSFPLHHLYVDLGGEWRQFDRLMFKDRIHMQPFLAAFARANETFGFDPNFNCALGAEWASAQKRDTRKVRTAFEYYTGRCLDGQFGKKTTDHFSFRFSYGY